MLAGVDPAFVEVAVNGSRWAADHRDQFVGVVGESSH
jgi:hypothetical protein